jgi:TonB-linked SusC/RagA family outer membrane protein
MKRKLTPILMGLLALCLLCVHPAFAQNKSVSGKVTDSKDGSPVVGASVTVKGTKLGTQTDAAGAFTLSVPASATTLVISSVGFGVKEATITSGSVDVALTASTANDLNEVVVVGYGTARKRDLTGSTASVQAKDFNKGTYTSPDQLIQGKAAGVLVINNTGQPGGSTTIRIRGSSSIRSGNQPLFVVDGVPLSGGSARPGGSGGNFGNDGGNPLNYMNPNDIAGIEILKDASSTAIYGSRGANGVILITTKRGKSGAPSLDASASVGISKVAKILEVLDGNEYRAALKDYGVTAGDFGKNVNAFDAITQTGITQNYNVAVGGGTDDARYRLSAGYLNQEGAIKTSELKKLSVNLTSSFKFLPSKKLGLDINVLVTQTNERIAPISAFVGFEGNLISQALQWNPTHELIKPGTDSAWIDPAVGLTTINPLAQLNYFKDKAIVNTIIASIAPSYKITNDLEYKFLYSVNRQVGSRRGQVDKTLNVVGIEGKGVAFMNNSEQTNSQVTNTLSYNKKVSSDLNVNAVIGHEWLVFDSKNSGMNGQDFASYGLNYYDYMQNTSQSSRNIGSYASPTTELQSFFARAIVNYKDKYLLTGTFRADGSTRFGENHKYGYFPSVGFAWNVSKEGFLENNDFVKNLKFRASWGKTGNQEFPSGASLNRYSIGQGIATTRTNWANPDLKWETSATINVGLDFSIFNERLTGTVDYFNKKTTDVLFEQNIIQPAPGGKIWLNIPGNIINKGVEVSLYASVIRGKDVNWNIGGNASFLQNEVNDLLDFYQTGQLRGQGFSDVFGQRVVSGQPLNVWYLQKFEGIDKNTGASIFAENGKKYYLGSPNPKMLLGLSTDFSYKKLTATINMNGNFGQYIFNNTAASVLGITNLGSRNIAKSTIESGDVKESTSNAPAASTRNLEKGNYVKMTNATLSYRIGSIGNFRNVNISLTGQNLFVITKYTGFDPEVNTDGGVGGIPSLGIEYIPYPSARTFTLGVNFSL